MKQNFLDLIIYFEKTGNKAGLLGILDFIYSKDCTYSQDECNSILLPLYEAINRTL